jgi:hypothetical protein
LRNEGCYRGKGLIIRLGDSLPASVLLLEVDAEVQVASRRENDRRSCAQDLLDYLYLLRRCLARLDVSLELLEHPIARVLFT